MEVLAPAGGPEQLRAAVRSGADAVYLGARSFNARRRAENFGGESLKEAVAYCHGRDVRVFVTVNTLVRDEELGEVYAVLEEIGESGADAVILQDLAAADLFRTHLPGIARHASTQMTIHNADGAKAAEELGFSRVILARELTLEEIRRIREASGIELECFVHGALCMSVSGQCLLSAALGERSGNRGLCAQPCRLDFRAGDRAYALSLKDACLVPHLGELEAAGVSSLKIEGRLRRPEYVAAATDACIRALRGEQPDLRQLERAFSRSGLTDGYLTGRRDLSMFGSRTEEDKAASAAVLGQLAGLYRRELSRVPVSFTLRGGEERKTELLASDGRHTVAAAGQKGEPVRTAAQDTAGILGKTGGTPFLCAEIRSEVEPGWMIPGLSALRREALERLLEERERAAPLPVVGAFAPEPGGSRDGEPKLRVRFARLSQVFDVPEAEAIYLPVEELDEGLVRRWGPKLIGELPRLIWPGREAALEQRLPALKAAGLETLCAGNLGSLRLASRLGFRVSGGFDLNIENSRALRAYEALGVRETLLSLEIPMSDARHLGGQVPRGILLYGHMPLMLFRCCPMQGKDGCGSCDGRRSLKDRQGADFPVLCHRRQYSTLLNPVPLYVGDKALRGLDYGVVWFSIEEREECREIWKRCLEKGTWPGNRTNGPYYRRLR
ncbi:MAG: U32 family peptidase [Oscillospiraceae bacterium]|nr:U32 family peptidase [Oscillospiraceae bacterium]